MTDIEIQLKFDDINRKLDMVLEELIAQKQSRQTVEDFVADVSLIGTDVFKATVTELDNAGVEVDGEALKQLAFKFIRNIDTFNELFGMLESANDLMKDVTPIIHQVGLDSIKAMNEFEEKGYFEFIKELGKMMDNVVTHFGAEDVKKLSENVVPMLELVKSLTQPEMLKALTNGINVYKSLDTENIPEYSLWKIMREINTPEMKKGMGFMITFLKNIAKEN